MALSAQRSAAVRTCPICSATDDGFQIGSPTTARQNIANAERCSTMPRGGYSAFADVIATPTKPTPKPKRRPSGNQDEPSDPPKPKIVGGGGRFAGMKEYGRVGAEGTVAASSKPSPPSSPVPPPESLPSFAHSKVPTSSSSEAAAAPTPQKPPQRRPPTSLNPHNPPTPRHPS